MRTPHGHPKEGSLPLGGKARSAKGAHHTSARILFLLLALSAAPTTAMACGACVEDQVAATYDHAVMMQAMARHHVVVFASVASARNAKSDMRQIGRAASVSKGVDAASVRVSDEPSALYFDLDPTAGTPAAALTEIQTRLRQKGVKLTLLRVSSAAFRCAICPEIVFLTA